MKTLIAIPCMDTIPVGFAESLIYLRKGQNVSVMFKPNSLVYDSRNLISLTAIENKFDRVMWFDSDMMFQPDTMEKLSCLMDKKDCDMATGLYFKRTLQTEPVLYKEISEPKRDSTGRLARQIEAYTNYPKDGVFRVAGCGFGCVMTTTQLLKDVWKFFGPAFTPYDWASEDISFCYRVGKLGYDIYCDSSISCGHIGTYVYTDKDMKRGDGN